MKIQTILFTHATVARLFLFVFFMNVLSLSMTVKALTTYGDFTVTTTNGTVAFSSDILTLSASGDYTVGMATGVISTTNRILINVTGGSGTDTVRVTLNGVDIQTASGAAMEISSATTVPVKVILEGSNTLKSSATNAGLQKSSGENYNLTLTGDGSLVAIGGMYAAGIGGGSFATGSNITISGGNVNATGGLQGAGIGGGYYGAGNNITINGGNVTATGGENGAGIGGGNSGDGNNIIISGGTVTATGGNKAAGIGGGYSKSGSNIIVSGGTVTATGGTDASGIGNGYNCSTAASGIEISGGNVKASSISITPTNGQGSAPAVQECVYMLPRTCIGKQVTLSSGLPAYYGTTDIYALPLYYGSDTVAALFLYLPDGSVSSSISCTCNGEQINATHLNNQTLSGLTVTNADATSYSYSKGLLTLTGIDDYKISMTDGFTVTDYRIVIDAQSESNTDTVRVTLNGVNIQTTLWAAMGISSATNVPVKVILEGSNTLKSSATNYAGLQKNNGENYNLTITGSSTDSLVATGGTNAAGIGGGTYGAGSNITINSGTVTATGGTNGAGIGGGTYGAGSNITINGGNVTATGGESGAGIGGGYGAAGNNITINGGTVTATEGNNAAGIGGGAYGAGSNIIVSGGTVTATGGTGASGIGNGYDCSTAASGIEISGGNVKASSISITPTNGQGSAPAVQECVYMLPKTCIGKQVTLSSGLPAYYGTTDIYALPLYYGSDTVAALFLYLPDGSVSSSISCTCNGEQINATHLNNQTLSGLTVTNADATSYSYSKGLLTLTGIDDYKISMTDGFTVTDYRIVIDAQSESNTDTVRVTLNGVNIQTTLWAAMGISSATNVPVKVILEGSNTLKSSATNYAGLQKNNGENYNLTISGSSTDSLVATGGTNAAGIGGGTYGAGSNITISGGTVTATGGRYGAGIGGGEGSAGNNITISGGTVTATGGYNGAGIGGGYGAAGNNITISGGTVTATGGNDGAGIGGGNDGDGSNIIINGGTVTATGGRYGAGIGGGDSKSGSNIIVSGGTVTAMGGYYAAGIGGGNGGGRNGDGSNITISGGTVTATGGESGAGIGGGYNASGSNITISGGSVNADSISITPTNGQESSVSVYKYTYQLPTACAGKKVDIINGVPAYYGTNDIYADSLAKVYLYLPDATQPNVTFECEGTEYLCDVNGYFAFIITSSVLNNYTYNSSNNVITLDSVADYTVSMFSGVTTAAQRLVVTAKATGSGNTTDTVRVILNGVNIQTVSGAAFEIPDSVNVPVKIILEGVNTLKSNANNYAGLQKGNGENYNLTISGSSTDSLVAVGGNYAAGIGGGYYAAGSNITISGANVTATGGNSAAGIGGGYYAAGNNITISGANVTATGGDSAAGIGGGYGAAGNNIIINGGTVTATSGADATDIGDGNYCEYVSTGITISGGNVNATSFSITPTNGQGETPAKVSLYTYTLPATCKGKQVTLSSGLPAYYGTTDIYALPFYNGSDTVAAIHLYLPNDCAPSSIPCVCEGEQTATRFNYQVLSGLTVTEADATSYNFSKGLLTLTGIDDYKISMTDGFTVTDYRIIIDAQSDNNTDTVRVTLNGVNIQTERGAAMELSSNTAVPVKVILEGIDTLISTAMSYAGLQKSSGENYNLTLTGDGSLVAIGGMYAAGIGGGQRGLGSNITISGGTVTAKGGTNSAGIGGGDDAVGNNITISGGNVTATGGYYGAGIGGGFMRTGNNIIVSGGTVTATGGESGAGIGGGNGAAGNNITISGGTVTAKGGTNGAGIGGGTYGAGSNITINGGTVTAKGGTNGAGIGGGRLGLGSNITISGGNVNATGGSDAAGIGGGYLGSGNNITINGGTVTAKGGTNGAGIGGGNGAAGNNITINGGTMTATGGNNAAGIGGGNGAAGNNITINGGTMTATGGNKAAGIGGGSVASGSNITINSGTVTATGGLNAAGIGGGQRGLGSNITISGGNVNATGGGNAADIGCGNVCSTASTNIVISGGSVNADSISITPTNGAANGSLAVTKYSYTLPEANTLVTDLYGLDIYSYGTKDIYTDSLSRMYLWLPDTLVRTDAGSYTMSSACYGTLCYPAPVVLTNGIRASKIEGIKNDGFVQSVEVKDTIPAHTPVILWGEADATLTLPVAYYHTDSVSNEGLLYGTYKSVQAETGSYVLQNKANGVAFYKVGASRPTVATFRCWLETLDGSSIQAIRFEEGSFTGIYVPEAIDEESEGEVVIFDLNGRRVTEPESGRVYIVNGKKQLILRK